MNQEENFIKNLQYLSLKDLDELTSFERYCVIDYKIHELLENNFFDICELRSLLSLQHEESESSMPRYVDFVIAVFLNHHHYPELMVFIKNHSVKFDLLDIDDVMMFCRTNYDAIENFIKI